MKGRWEVMVVVVVMVSLAIRKTTAMPADTDVEVQDTKPVADTPIVSQTMLFPPKSPLSVPKNAIPINFVTRNDAFITCSEQGWYPYPSDCAHFYYCPDKSEQQFTRPFHTYSCYKGKVFNPSAVECEPGMCWGGDGHKYPLFGEEVVMDPGMAGAPGSPPPDESLPPPPPPGSVLTGSSTGSQSQVPPWLNKEPVWFSELPWWFKTPPSWFQSPPAWFNAPPASHVSTLPTQKDTKKSKGDEEGTADYVTKNVNLGTNTSLSGADATGYKDEKTLEIHIPIKIIQQ